MLFWLKIIQTLQVGGVLESSGPPPADGHRDFWNWCLGPPPGKISQLGRTEMGAWQDRKWEAWQKIICKTSHFATFSFIFCLVSATFGWFPCFSSTFACFAAIYLSFLPIGWQLGRKAWYSSLAEHMAPLAGRNFGRMKLLAPPQKWPRYAYAAHRTLLFWLWFLLMVQIYF